MDQPKKHCPRCGRELKADAPSGLCPSCLMEINLHSGVSQPAGRGGAAPLPVEEVAKRFPEMEILCLLGAGGMGAVYKARQPKLDRLVALKILSHERDDAGFIERFTREAQTLAKLDHPNIVAVHDFGERDGLFFLIMELVDGVTLRDLLSEGRLKPEQALAIVPPICEALQFAHDKGVVHRDIKPENILMDKAGVVKVADFGIARMTGLEGEKNLTGEGQVVGTAHYMAPEQVERPAEVDHRADIYALGVVFYEMLTGELPLGRFLEPSKKVQIDVRLDEVVLRALENQPALRYQTAEEMKTRVETVLGGEMDVFIAEKEPSRARDKVRRRLLLPAVGLIATAGINFMAALYHLAGVLLRGETADHFLFFLLIAGSSVIVCGAVAMLRLKDWKWALAGAIAAMLIFPGLMLGIPFGIWTLVAMFRAEARGAFAAPQPISGNGIRRRSKREIFGLPLWNVALGADFSGGETRGHARGIFAVGDMATGWFALGGVARGGVAIGGVAIGLVSIGGAAFGLLGALGGLAVALVAAVGGGAVGMFALGGGAAGYYASGGGTLRVHDLADGISWHKDVSMDKSSGEHAVTFPNGVSFEVAAICRNPRNSDVWWRADGTLLPRGTVKVVSGLEEGGVFARLRAEREREAAKTRFGAARTSENTPENEVLIYVRRVYPENWPDDLYGEMLEWSRPPSRMESLRFPNVRWRGGEVGSSELLWFNDVPDVLDLSVRVPLGPWEPIALFQGDETRQLVSGVEVSFRPSGAGDHDDLMFEITHDVDFHEYDLRVVARLKDGSERPVFQHSTSKERDGGFTTYVTFSKNSGLEMEKVKEFELARTELATARIEGIQLSPGKAGERAGEPAEPVGVSLRADEDAPRSDEPAIRMRQVEIEPHAGHPPAPEPDPVGAAQMVQAFKGQFFSAYTALIEKDDPETALVVMQLMISQTDEFLAKLKGTPAEHAVAGGIAQLRLAITALEEGNTERAKVLFEGLNSYGPEFEKMINQAAAEGRSVPRPLNSGAGQFPHDQPAERSEGESAAIAQPPQAESLEQQEKLQTDRPRYARDWMLAFHMYASMHEGRCPKTFEEAAPYFRSSGAAESGLTPEQFEIVHQGSLTELTNWANVIVIRQKEGWQGADGAWRKAYGFADGHAETHAQPDSDFGPWEARHRAKDESR